MFWIILAMVTWLFDTAAILTQHSKTGVLRDVN